MIKTISDLHDIPRGIVLTIGNFDGVHLGHQKILHVAREVADKYNTSAAIMTFDPHPLAVLHPHKAPGTLTPLALGAHTEKCTPLTLFMRRTCAPSLSYFL